MKTSILVLIYNKEMEHSQTLLSLLECCFIDSELLIFNNGPRDIAEDNLILERLRSRFSKVSFGKCLENAPLSNLYNEYIEKNNSHRYILLDDDTILNKQYFDSIDKVKALGEVDIQLPGIYSSSDVNSSLCYPLIDYKPVPLSVGSAIPQERVVFSIGSGIVIYSNLVEIFREKNLQLFDQRFALYGVDFSFFHRINILKKAGYKISMQLISPLHHSRSLSKNRIESWRRDEKMIDSILSIKFYSKSKVRMIYHLMKFLIDNFNNLTFRRIFLLIDVFIKGRHPRANTNNSKGYL